MGEIASSEIKHINISGFSQPEWKSGSKVRQLPFKLSLSGQLSYNTSMKWEQALRKSIPLFIAATGICALIYGAVQQNYRQSLNDPQIQMAEDAANAIAQGEIPAALVPHGTPVIDITKSLSPFMVIYDESDTPLESSGVLDGQPPVPPKGVFDYARQYGSNLPHNTWQPRLGVRIAAVLVHVPGDKGFVLVGRNMLEVERREMNLTLMVGAAWVFILLAVFASNWVLEFL